MNFTDFIADTSITIKEALNKIDINGEKTLILTETSGEIAAIITDGDIRRYLISGGTLNDNAYTAANHKPIFAEGYHEPDARELLVSNDLECIPMTDKNGIVHTVVFEQGSVYRCESAINFPVVMMAGGLGTRLYPYTSILPKPLIPIGDKTITELILERFYRFGCTDMTLVVNHKKNLIKSYFSEVSLPYTVSFADEDTPLGTGGGLSFLAGKYETPVFVTCCDNIIEANYAEIAKLHTETNSILTMVCADHEVVVPYGVINTDEDGAILSMEEKPSFRIKLNAGMYLVNPEFIDRIPKDTFVHITDLIKEAIDRGERVSTYLIEDKCFVDIGKLSDLHSVVEKY